jgi:hypothetical protein
LVGQVDMKRQLNLKEKFIWKQDEEFTVWLQNVNDDSFHIHLDINTELSLSKYKKLWRWFDELFTTNYKFDTIVETEEQRRFAEHFGFLATHYVELNGKQFILMRGV